MHLFKPALAREIKLQLVSIGSPGSKNRPTFLEHMASLGMGVVGGEEGDEYMNREYVHIRSSLAHFLLPAQLLQHETLTMFVLLRHEVE